MVIEIDGKSPVFGTLDEYPQSATRLFATDTAERSDYDLGCNPCSPMCGMNAALIVAKYFTPNTHKSSLA